MRKESSRERSDCVIADKQTDRQTSDRQTDRQTNKQIDRHTGRQTDRQTNRRLTDRDRDGQIEIQVVYHLPKNSGNFGWDVNGKTILVCPNGNFPQ